MAGVLAIVVAAVCVAAASAAEPRHAIAMHGEPAWPAGFDRLPYANPDAPKGGRLVQGVLGTFDSLNPLIVKGLAVQAVRGYVIESLMARGYDEPFTLYGLLARTVETDDARSYVTFSLDPAAHFSDGVPVTAEDVVFSWRLLRDKGRLNHRTYYSKVTKAEILDPRTVRFDLTGANDRELPLILGLMPVLAKHAIDEDTFEQTTFKPMIGSGPYVIGEVRPGESVTFKHDPNYWARDLPITRGLWNFDEVRFDFYRDGNTHFEAFKRGLYDARPETDPGRWNTGYDFPAVREGRVLKEAIRDGLPKGMQAFAFNTRRALFADIRVRQALAELFDFEWINKSIYFGAYERTGSYFEGSELSARGRPADARERALLAPFPDAVRPDVMDGTWQPPVADGSGRDRTQVRRALELLKQAGYVLKGSRLVNKRTGKPFAFEFLAADRDQERLASLYAHTLRQAGIVMSIRAVDAVQYDRRLLTYDYDMMQYFWDESLSPGNEQAFYWGSQAADADGTRNYMGAKNPAVDAMIDALLKARDRQEFVSAVRALDRVLISGCYVVPLFYLPAKWLARWDTIERPKRTSLFGILPETWWASPTNAEAPQ